VPVVQRYSVYLIEKLDTKNDGKGITVLLDCKGAGVKNVDMDLMQFHLKITREYYPGLLTVVLVHKLPVVLEPVFKAVIAWLKDDEKHFLQLTKKKNINEYIAKDQLPDFLLGTNQASYRVIPSGAPTSADVAKRLGIKEEKVDKVLKHLQQFYNE